MLNKPFKLEKIATLANFLPNRVTVVLTYNFDQNKIIHSFKTLFVYPFCIALVDFF